MKKIYSLLVFFLCFSGNAQIVNIPDPVFKSWLISYGCDTNADGEIQVSEAEAVSYLEIWTPSITNLEGLQSFINILEFKIPVGNNTITSIDMSALTHLLEIELVNCTALTNVTINAPQLTSLIITNSLLSSIDLSSMTNIITIDLNHNQLTTINLPLSSNLNYLDLSYNNLTTLNGTFGYMFYFDIRYNNLTTFNATINGGQEIYLSHNLLTFLDFSLINNDISPIEYLDLRNNPFTSLDLTELAYVGFPSNSTSLFIGSSTSLISVKIPANLYFGAVYIQNCSNLAFIDFKNNYCDGAYGISGIWWSAGNPRWYISNCPNVTFCVDSNLDCGGSSANRNEEFFFSHLNIIYQDATVPLGTPPTNNASPYCSFLPSGSYNTVTGNLKMDCGGTNSNLSNVKINASINSNDIPYTFTNNDGNYTHYIGQNSITVSPQFENPSYFTVTPPNYVYNFTTTDNNETANFCISPNGVHPDLEIKIIPITPARPSFDAKYNLVYKNKGTQTQTGTISLSFNDAVLDFVNANPTTTSQVLNMLNWTFTNLEPFESRTIELNLNVNSPTETPAVNNGDVLSFIVSLITPETDETPSNNSHSFNQVVVGSFDPNDKQVVEGSQVSISSSNDYLTYIVRFQNTGTYAAENVFVKDILSNNLDINSLEIVGASHPFRNTLTYQNILEFFFENINLPASSVDEPASHGYIIFKIKPKNTVVVGNAITNKASIYFDYNNPIITNTVTTTFTNLGSDNFVFDNYFNLHPNPATNVLNLTIKNPIVIKTVEIYNTLGQLIMSIPNEIYEDMITVNISNLNTGLYFISVTTEKGKTTQRFIKK